MKIKTDFITNSSSCCFIIQTPNVLGDSDIFEKGFHGRFNQFHSCGTIEELIAHTDDEPCDWVKKITGPRRFWGVIKERYEIAKKVIENGECVSFIDIERDSDDVESFDRIMRELDCKVILREYD